jgi:hypothetical protein
MQQLVGSFHHSISIAMVAEVVVVAAVVVVAVVDMVKEKVF